MAELRITRRSAPLRPPLRAAWGIAETREWLEAEIVGEDGLVGVGECSPLPAYDPVGLDECQAALERCREPLRGLETTPVPGTLDACRDATEGCPWALAAVDAALWDRAGKRAERPVAMLLTEDPLDRVGVAALIGADSPSSAASEAAAAVAAEFTTVKVKVGDADEVDRVAAVRDAIGPGPRLRLDVNGAWTPAITAGRIEALAQYDIEFVEEPVSGLRAYEALRENEFPVPIAMDETAAEERALAAGLADIIVLKVGRAGGIAALLAQSALVRAGGGEPLIASALDGPLGIAASVHVAAALRSERASGLGTLPRLGDVEPGPLRIRDGAIAVPGPGLGGIR